MLGYQSKNGICCIVQNIEKWYNVLMTGINSSGRLDLPITGSDVSSRAKNMELPGKVGSMRAQMFKMITELRGIETKEKPKDETKTIPETKKEEKVEPKTDAKDDKVKKDDKASKTAA